MAVAERKEWYLEYEITINRAGLLGDISSLLGMLELVLLQLMVLIKAKGFTYQNDKLEKLNVLNK